MNVLRKFYRMMDIRKGGMRKYADFFKDAPKELREIEEDKDIPLIILDDDDEEIDDQKENVPEGGPSQINENDVVKAEDEDTADQSLLGDLQIDEEVEETVVEVVKTQISYDHEQKNIKISSTTSKSDVKIETVEKKRRVRKSGDTTKKVIPPRGVKRTSDKFERNEASSSKKRRSRLVGASRLGDPNVFSPAAEKEEKPDHSKVLAEMKKTTPDELVEIIKKATDQQNSVTDRSKPVPWKRFREFKAKVPEKCFEAIRGGQNGSLKLKIHGPGLPTRKFSSKDLKKYGSVNKCWPVQELFKSNQECKLHVIYSGWGSDTSSLRLVEELRKTAPEMVADCEARTEIEKLLPRVANMRNYINEPNSIFWAYSDLSYFHSIINEIDKLPAIRYIVPPKQYTVCLEKKFPKYSLTNQNLVTDRALAACFKNTYSRHVDELIKDVRSMSQVAVKTKGVRKVCPSESCKCQKRYKWSYGGTNVALIPYDNNGRIVYEECEGRVVIECSDACGCTIENCPNRQMQKGSTVEMIVFYEGKGKGFGVRAGRDIVSGEYIAEYTGLIRMDNEIETSSNYLFTIESVPTRRGTLVVDATDYGNATRFINHSCDPNAVFSEVYCREKEEDVLIPRVGIFATRNINKGDEILLSYWNLTDVVNAQLGRCKTTACTCGSERCRKYIPLN